MEITITEDFDGRTVKDLLYKLGVSHGAITRLKKIPDGITLNGNHVTVRKVLTKGDILRLMTEDLSDDENKYLIPEKMSLEILYEDSDVLALNKPPHMPTHISLGHRTGTLSNGVAYYFSSRGIPFVFRAVNRLDRDTSGVVLIAKNRISSARLSEILQSGKIRKKYIAILEGRLPSASGEINGAIRRVPDSIMLREVCHAGDNGAKTALTRYEVLGYGDGLTVVSAEPVTGRTHQLRVHFSSLGCPILGDGLYGNANGEAVIGRQALHAYSLDIDFGGRKLSITAPLPEDMKSVINKIGLSEIFDEKR